MPEYTDVDDPLDMLNGHAESNSSDKPPPSKKQVRDYKKLEKIHKKQPSCYKLMIFSTIRIGERLSTAGLKSTKTPKFTTN